MCNDLSLYYICSCWTRTAPALRFLPNHVTLADKTDLEGGALNAWCGLEKCYDHVNDQFVCRVGIVCRLYVVSNNISHGAMYPIHPYNNITSYRPLNWPWLHSLRLLQRKQRRTRLAHLADLLDQITAAR